jgi:hypothetical protein
VVWGITRITRARPVLKFNNVDAHPVPKTIFLGVDELLWPDEEAALDVGLRQLRDED